MAVGGRTLTIYLAADTKKATRGIESFNDKLTKFAKVGALAAGVAVGVLAVKMAEFVGASVEAARQAKVTEDRLRNVTKQMGLTKGEYKGATDRVLEYASALSKATGIEDDTIIAVQTKLATFKELTTSINDAGGAFDRATEAAFDLAAAGFGTAESNAVQLGKALNDPVKGLASLARAGITFTDAEKERIAALVESNKMGEAQALVLEAIETQVGGTAEATATASDKMQTAWGELQESVGTTLLPAFDDVANFVTADLIPKLSRLWEFVSPKITEAWDNIKDSFLDFRREFRNTDWSKELEDLQTMMDQLGGVGDAWSSLYDTITGSKSGEAETKQHSLIGLMKQFISIMSSVVTYYTTVWRVILTALEKVWSAFFWLKDKMDGLAAWWEGYRVRIRSAFVSIGTAIWQGLKEGVAPIVNVVTGISDTIGKLPALVKGGLGIQSPSKVFIDIGGNIVKGFEIGVSGLKDVNAKVKGEFDGLVSTTQSTIDKWVDDAKDRLREAGEDFRSFASGVKDNLLSALSLSSTDTGAFDPAAWAAQVKANTDWSVALRDIANNPAFSDPLVTMLAQMGPEAGLKFVESLTPAMITQLNTDLASMELITEETGNAMAERFKRQGISDAEAHMAGLEERINEKLDWLYRQGRKMGLAVSKGYRDATASLLESGAGNARSAEANTRAAGGTVNVTVQAGIGNPIEIARTIESVLAAKYARVGVA